MLLRNIASIAVLLLAYSQMAIGSNLQVDNESMPVAQQTSGYQQESIAPNDKRNELTKALSSIALSAELNLPHDVKVHILTYLTDQKDLLRIGATSRGWRQASQTIWNTREFVFPRQTLTEHDNLTLGRGIFSRVSLADKGLENKDIEAWMKTLSGSLSINLDERAGEKAQEDAMTEPCKSRGQLEKLIFSWIAPLRSVWRFFYPLTDRWHASIGYNTCLTALDLSRNNIGTEGARSIAKTLIHLTRLDLAWNRIGAEGAKAIADTLTQLTSLDLRYNRTGAEGTKAIASTITQLTSLDLYGSRIGDEGAKAIANTLTQLTSLNLERNSIGAEGAKAIANTLTQLTSLDLSYNDIVAEGAQAIANALLRLLSLDLCCNNIEAVGTKAIADKLSQLTRLEIGYNDIDEEGQLALIQLGDKNPKMGIIS